MAKTTLLRARIDSGRKDRAEKILGRYGLTPAQAINVFYAKVAETNGLPFDLRPSESADLMADPEFRTYFARLKSGQVSYHDAKVVPA
jgi:addiction module RelB/DinJ family antitoxin